MVKQLGTELGLIASRGLWNMAAYRRIFCNWNVIYTGLLPDADLCVARLLGTILRIICRTDHPADDYECSTIVWVFFIARVWVEYGLRKEEISEHHTANLYWQSVPLLSPTCGNSVVTPIISSFPIFEYGTSLNVKVRIRFLFKGRCECT